jgi:hypothetical protein
MAGSSPAMPLRGRGSLYFETWYYPSNDLAAALIDKELRVKICEALNSSRARGDQLGSLSNTITLDMKASASRRCIKPQVLPIATKSSST